MIFLLSTLEYWFKEKFYFSDENKAVQRKDHKLVEIFGFQS